MRLLAQNPVARQIYDFLLATDKASFMEICEGIGEPSNVCKSALCKMRAHGLIQRSGYIPGSNASYWKAVVR